MLRSTRSTACVSICSLFLMTLGNPIPASACPDPVENKTTVNSAGNMENCGDTEWELKALVPHTCDGCDGNYDEGPYDGSGTCYGGYTECNCSIAPMEYITPSINMMQDSEDNFDGTYTMYFWWNATEYLGQINYSSCGGSGQCASTGHGIAVPQATTNPGIDNDYDYEVCDV